MRPRRPIVAAVLVLFLAAVAALTTAGARADEEPPKLLGRITPADLREEPYSGWFEEGYDAYVPNPDVTAALRAAGAAGVEVTVFFGTWCPDSRREVPRLLKLLQTLQFPKERLTLVAVDNAEGRRKTSPGGEEKGMRVYRVPTIIVLRDGAEIGRIVEHPVRSLERDLLAILTGRPYTGSFPSYPVIDGWLAEGLLADPNLSPWGLAGELRPLVGSEWDLLAVAATLLERGDGVEAVLLFRVNTALYRDSAMAFARLAGALRDTGEPGEARDMARRALRLNTDPDRVPDLADLLESIDAGEETGE
ncbi:MAG: hypothetical protein PVF68_12330 [Acidobacteriota bacterium]|jgi:thiol-disulfide isomerase/thioredoxin